MSWILQIPKIQSRFCQKNVKLASSTVNKLRSKFQFQILKVWTLSGLKETKVTIGPQAKMMSRESRTHLLCFFLLEDLVYYKASLSFWLSKRVFRARSLTIFIQWDWKEAAAAKRNELGWGIKTHTILARGHRDDALAKQRRFGGKGKRQQKNPL